MLCDEAQVRKRLMSLNPNHPALYASFRGVDGTNYYCTLLYLERFPFIINYFRFWLLESWIALFT